MRIRRAHEEEREEMIQPIPKRIAEATEWAESSTGPIAEKHPLVEAGYKLPQSWLQMPNRNTIIKVCCMCKKAFEVHKNIEFKKYYCSFKCRAIGK